MSQSVETSRSRDAQTHVALEVPPSRQHRLQLGLLVFVLAVVVGVGVWRVLNGLVDLNTRFVVVTVLVAV